MCKDALDRNESCGGHFGGVPDRGRQALLTTTTSTPMRQPGNGPAMPGQSNLHKEDLDFQFVKPTQRGYK